jgi:hypothetical protein
VYTAAGRQSWRPILVEEVAPLATSKITSRAFQRQVDLTTAVCQERLLATHVKHVIALVDLVAEEIAFDEALDIYVRVLRLAPEQARNIGSRSLAELGRREASGGSVPRGEVALEERDDQDDEPVPSGEMGRADALFARLRRRVRGRVQADLRYRINLAAARTEDDLLETHVGNALLFARALASELNELESVEFYLETMMLPEGTADVIYHRALRQIADQVLPSVGTESGPPSGRDSAGRIGLPMREARR